MRELQAKLKRCRQTARELRSSPVEKRNQVLLRAADQILACEAAILSANREDLCQLTEDVSAAFRDRLELNPERLALAAEGLRQVAALADPVGEIMESRTLNNGLKLQKVRSPLGVILMIFESRPNVAMEAFSLAFKSGNVIVLRGGRESQRTVGAIYSILRECLSAVGLSEDCFWGITDSNRDLVKELLGEYQWIDVVVPRGGDGLIEFVVRNSRIPIIKNDRGLCHVYIDAAAEVRMAIDIAINAKTQRPGVCNAMETLLVHDQIAEKVLPAIARESEKYALKWFGCERTRRFVPQASQATPAHFDTEHLDYLINCRVVESVTEAIAHIEQYGSRHSESIVTENEETARLFQREVDAAAVYWNASTRFTDGFEFGLGGELGISTQKLHVRGPVGLKELTCGRWLIDGEGQVRS